MSTTADRNLTFEELVRTVCEQDGNDRAKRFEAVIERLSALDAEAINSLLTQAGLSTVEVRAAADTLSQALSERLIADAGQWGTGAQSIAILAVASAVLIELDKEAANGDVTSGSADSSPIVGDGPVDQGAAETLATSNSDSGDVTYLANIDGSSGSFQNDVFIWKDGFLINNQDNASVENFNDIFGDMNGDNALTLHYDGDQVDAIAHVDDAMGYHLMLHSHDFLLT